MTSQMQAQPLYDAHAASRSLKQSCGVVAHRGRGKASQGKILSPAPLMPPEHLIPVGLRHGRGTTGSSYIP